MPPRKSPNQRLYDKQGTPVQDFNVLVRAWLADELKLVEHAPPKAFDFMRQACDLEIENLLRANPTHNRARAQRALLSDMTRLMFGDDISGRLSERLSADQINPAGFRSQLAQAVAKNTGENFINAIVYALADCLLGQDDILVDKGMPPPLRPYLTMFRDFSDFSGTTRTITIAIEADVAIWHRHSPKDAIIVSAKTRLKEVFHIATMWKLFYDMIGDTYCRTKWKLRGPPEDPNMLYVFATGDMIRTTGTNTQGPDVERGQVRNLIAMDAAFYDYVFVSKTQVGHVSPRLSLAGGREALFHELGCLVDLIEQRFSIVLCR